MQQVFDFVEGTTPVLVSMPHVGTDIPEALAGTMTPVALELADTDWHLQRLYDFAPELGAGVIRPFTHRYVIDLNRPPDNAELYPGSNGTELCPTSTFADQPLYRDGATPMSQEIDRRLETFWMPYHQQLQSELQRLRQQFGVAVLFEAHSIRSQVPRLFEGRLPELSLGTAEGNSCASELQAAVEELFSGQSDYQYVVNQRFKGGYITRAYGDPTKGVHSLQLELCQHTYMQEQTPFHYLPAKAAEVRPLLKQLLQTLIDWSLKEADSL